MRDPAIAEWVTAAREKLKAGALTEEDLRNLENLDRDLRQMVIYLYAKSANMRSAVSSWALYDPTAPCEPTLPAQEPPYSAVVEAVADGWRIVQFPISKLYGFSDLDNDYLGFEFILEKWA